MSDVEITIKLPEQLVKRANAVGLNIEGQGETIADVLEKEILRREASESIDSQLAQMASDLDIQREIRLIQAEFAGADSDGLNEGS